MRKFAFNLKVRKQQVQLALGVVFVVVLLFMLLSVAFTKPKAKEIASKKESSLLSIIDESFTKEMNDEALLKQQTHVASLQKHLTSVDDKFEKMNEKIEALTKALEEKSQKDALEIKALTLTAQNAMKDDSEAMLNKSLAQNHSFTQPRQIHMVSFRKRKPIRKINRLNPAHYVPSNTHVRAVVLGGADADASVNGQSKNNGVMLFKFIEDGTLPNGLHSRLKGCLVSGNSYGDISSERAFATLYKISCAKKGQPIIDKEVSGWVFYNGKVGVKGIPLMRDNKVLQWAGISGALAGIAEAAQYAQSVQQFGAFGAQSVVPSSNIAPYAGYGGAAKAADTLAQYYVKRAEQYHPVIQVGAGNKVTIVFKDGFYLDEEEQQSYQKESTHPYANNNSPNAVPNDDADFTVPSEVLERIDNANRRKTYDVEK